MAFQQLPEISSFLVAWFVLPRLSGPLHVSIQHVSIQHASIQHASIRLAPPIPAQMSQQEFCKLLPRRLRERPSHQPKAFSHSGQFFDFLRNGQHSSSLTGIGHFLSHSKNRNCHGSQHAIDCDGTRRWCHSRFLEAFPQHQCVPANRFSKDAGDSSLAGFVITFNRFLGTNRQRVMRDG